MYTLGQHETTTGNHMDMSAVRAWHHVMEPLLSTDFDDIKRLHDGMLKEGWDAPGIRPMARETH